MDRLPTELIDSIVCMVNQDVTYSSSPPVPFKIAPFARISRSWRNVAERYTFRDLTLKDDEDWEKFVEYMSHVERRNCLKKLTVMKLPGNTNGLEDDHWRSLARCLETVYAELDNWGEGFAVRRLDLRFPVHPVIAAAGDADHTKLRCEVPYTDLSKYFLKEFTLPVWPSIQNLWLYGDNHRISLIFFSKLANACPNLVSWRLDVDEYERLNPKLVQ